MTKLTDKSALWFGMHKGTALKDVPASYLLWILNTWKEIPPPLHAYLVENQDALLEEQAEQDKDRDGWDDVTECGYQF